MIQQQIERAARAISEADGLIIGAGAGMGVDSGLPDFRGAEGFWRAYPALRGKDFTQMANPAAFKSNPRQAWGFYGHRLNLYRTTSPHAGFRILKKLGESMPYGYQVFTSNVDGQFQLAEFDEQRIYECHGSIHHLQCSRPCSDDIWSADQLSIVTDDQHCVATSTLPLCAKCGAMARPNILMFGDFCWNSRRSDVQEKRLFQNIAQMHKPVMIECGAGTSIPTVRYFCERQNGILIRINPRESRTSSKNDIGISLGAREALLKINECLVQRI